MFRLHADSVYPIIRKPTWEHVKILRYSMSLNIFSKLGASHKASVLLFEIL